MMRGLAAKIWTRLRLQWHLTLELLIFIVTLAVVLAHLLNPDSAARYHLLKTCLNTHLGCVPLQTNCTRGSIRTMPNA